MIEELGRYRILEEIGQGSFATVYRAQDPDLQRMVAIKVLRPGLLQKSDSAQRFKQEARTIAHLDHHRIVTIHELGQLEQQLFIVMRLIEGNSLDQHLSQDGPVAWSDTLAMIQAIAEGLDHAHSQGILHRDLKPANILLDPVRGPLLTDFGLAKLVGQADTSFSASGVVVGTPHYLAPEVWEGQQATVQADIYALGCILYEMLTGQRLFKGDSPPAVMMAHFQPLQLPQSWADDVPNSISRLLAQALAKDPDERFATAGELVVALIEADTGKTSAAITEDIPADRVSLSATVPHKLPIQLTRFIGRQHELSEIPGLLATFRLVTLTGTAGCGKSRLASRVAQAVNDRYPDGIYWLELAPQADPALLPQTIAKGLRLKEQTDRPALQTVIDTLHNKQLLLILDNCEHVLTACTQLVTTLLAETTISILTTSREPLSITGERLYPVPPLSLPPGNHTLDDVTDMSQFDAIQLFVERARTILPAFELTADNAGVVASICQNLDGIPLAIELASVRVNVLTAEQIAARLDNHFALLAPAEHFTYSPHQTLRAAIDWSYDLLTTPEQLLLQRLSVFAGGCSLNEAEMVCAGDGLEREQVLDLLASLVNKSLVTAVTLQRSEAHYSLLETIRQYGHEKLKEANDWTHIHDRHLQCFLQLTEEIEPKLKGEYQQVWLNWLEDKVDNIRAALSRSLASHQIEAGLRITTAIYLLWAVRGYVNEGFAWLERLLAAADQDVSPIVHANALAYAAILALFRGDNKAQQTYGSEAARLAEIVGEASKPALVWALLAQAFSASAVGDFETGFNIGQRIIELSRELGDNYQLASTLVFHSETAMNLGKFADARGMLEEALPLFQKTEDTHRTGMTFNVFGDLERCEQNYAQAKKYYEESIVTLRKVNAERDLASVKQNLGHASLHLGDVERAHALFSESMATQQEQQNFPGMAECLIGFAALATLSDKAVAGARLLAAARAIGGENLTAPWPATKMEYEHYLALARSKLTEQAFQSALAAGRILSIEEAVIDAQDIARITKSTHELSHQLAELTPREREVANLITQAKSNGEIAAELVLSKRTVESHIANIRSKLGFTERAQIVRWAIEAGLVDGNEQNQL